MITGVIIVNPVKSPRMRLEFRAQDNMLLEAHNAKRCLELLWVALFAMGSYDKVIKKLRRLKRNMLISVRSSCHKIYFFRKHRRHTYHRNFPPRLDIHNRTTFVHLDQYASFPIISAVNLERRDRNNCPARQS